MVVLAIAITVVIGIVNLHCLAQPAKEKSPEQNSIGKGEALDLSIRFGLLPCVHFNIMFDNH